MKTAFITLVIALSILHINALRVRPPVPSNHPILTSPTINKPLKTRHNFYVVNDNDNEMTLTHGTGRNGSTVVQANVDAKNRASHWYVTRATLKQGGATFKRGYYVHSSTQDNLVWTRRRNWRSGRVMCFFLLINRTEEMEEEL